MSTAILMHEPAPTDEYRRGFECGTTWAASLRSDRLLEEIEATRTVAAQLANELALVKAELDAARRAAVSAEPREPSAICLKQPRVGTGITCGACR